MKSIFFNGYSKKSVCIITVLLLCYQFVNAQTPTTQWHKCYGGSGFDGANSICQTSDGGYIVGGYSNSNDSQVTGNHGGMDCWVIKISSSGTLQWQKSYGGTGYEQINNIAVDINGGYIIAASTSSNNGDVSGFHGGISDAWIIKIDDTGHIVWQMVLGSSGFDFFNQTINTPDSGYLAVGCAGANDGDVSGISGSGDVWAVKFTKVGNIIWKKVYGGAGFDYASNVINTTDNGFLIASSTDGGGIVNNYHGGRDAWIIKINDTGGMVWNKAYGGSGFENYSMIQPLNNRNFIVGTTSNSTNGQVTGNHGSDDYWIFSINDTGAFLWEKSFGGVGSESFCTLFPTFDSGVIISGYTSILSGEVTSTHSLTGGSDGWIVKINDTGAILWENAFGGSSFDSAVGIIQTTDSGYIIAGGTVSNNWDVSGNHGSEDLWVFKLLKDPLVKVSVINSNKDILVYPTLTDGTVHIMLPKGYDDAQFVLTDINGKLINNEMNSKGLSRTVQLNNLPEGMYFLTIINKLEVNTFKLIYRGLK